MKRGVVHKSNNALRMDKSRRADAFQNFQNVKAF